MIKLTPILLAILYGFVMYRFSVWRTKQTLDSGSAELADQGLRDHMTRLAKALDVPRITVNLYEVPQVNGLAAPDGRIYITRGFYDLHRQGKVTAEELVSVIAHELGHVALGHARRRMIDFSSQNAMRMALAMVLSRIIPGLGGWIATGLSRLVAAGLSRSDEYEADAYASALMVKAGYGTEDQKSLFRKLDQLTGAGGAAMPAWFLSHPKASERIAAIEANEVKWKLTTPD